MNRAASADQPATVRRLTIALRVLAGVFLLAALLYLLGPLVGPARSMFQTLPFVSNSIVKVTLLAALCLYAAGDLARHRGLVPIILWAHLVSLGAMLLVLLLGDTSRVVDPGIGGPVPVSRVLWGASALDGVILMLLFVLWRAARPALPPPAPPAPSWLEPPEQWLRRLLQLLAGLFLLAALGYEAAAVLGLAPALVRELPFVTNSVVKVVTLALTARYITRDFRPRLSLVGPLVLVHAVSALAQGIYLAAAPALLLDAAVEPAGTLRQVLWGAIVLDGVIGALLYALYYLAWRARLGSVFFRPLEFRTLVALADVMIDGPDEPIGPEAAARNVDRALARLETERKGTFRIALAVIHYWPLLSLNPPLPELAAPLRAEFVRRRFYREAGRQRLWSFLRMWLQAFTRVGHQLSVLGFYSDARVHPSVGYRPFSVRARAQGIALPTPGPHPLVVHRPWDIDLAGRRWDACVIGSGAGGAIAAYTLAERGMEVLLLERGAYLEPRHFSEDELRQVGVLYQRGMLQMAEDFRFNVLQGNCVGGSTTVNNAICFAPPPERLAEWNAAGAGLDAGEVQEAVDWLRRFLQVGSLGQLGDRRHHPAARVIAPALERIGGELGLAAPAPFDANIRVAPDPNDCFGCGNCNIGCPWDRKLSMLDHTLPRAQSRFPGRLTIVAECEAERFRTRTGARYRAYELLARGTDGRSLRIRADRYVVSAGAIASSALLLRSGIGHRRPVGRGLAFNMLTPVFAEFDTPQDSYAGIQMGHYVTHAGNQFIIETWFSPPVGLATAMAGWFGEHYRNMRRAGHLVAYGMVVGTSATGRVRLSPLNGDSAFRFRPPPADMARLGLGLESLSRVLLEAGARRVLLNTWGDGTLTAPLDIGRVRALAADPEFITLASSHPQGGNAINHERARGVVDPDFRVHGYDNLYLADASVFPGSVQVNPQLTVMALARCAAGRIA